MSSSLFYSPGLNRDYLTWVVLTASTSASYWKEFVFTDFLLGVMKNDSALFLAGDFKIHVCCPQNKNKTMNL